MVNQHIGNHGLGFFWCGQIWPGTPPSRSIEDSQTYNCLELAYYWSYKFGMVNKLQEIMGWEFFCVVGFDLGPLFQGQTRIAKLKKCLWLTYYWSERFGMVNHPKFFGWESFGMVRFDLWTPSSWSNEDIAFIVFL